MKKLNIVFCFFSFFLFSQVQSFAQKKIDIGVIKYKHTEYYNSADLPPNSPTSNTTMMALSFNEFESLYQKDPDIKEAVADSGEGSRFWSRFRQNSMNKTIYINLKDKTKLDYINFFEREFLVTDEVPNAKWKISAGEQKIIAGYTCMKAIYQDSTITYFAYFTTQIPKKIGPDRFGNLPGVILEVQSEKLHIIATEVMEKTHVIEIPKKGKKMTKLEFDKMRDEKTKEMREMMGRRMRG